MKRLEQTETNQRIEAEVFGKDYTFILSFDYTPESLCMTVQSLPGEDLTMPMVILGLGEVLSKLYDEFIVMTPGIIFRKIIDPTNPELFEVSFLDSDSNNKIRTIELELAICDDIKGRALLRIVPSDFSAMNAVGHSLARITDPEGVLELYGESPYAN